MNKKYYFASDVHLGLPPSEKATERERRFVRWLDSIKNDAEEIFLLGDIFDFWFEYKKVAPRGFTRTLGKIAEITDSGIPVRFIPGNHDLWAGDYLVSETGIILHDYVYERELSGKKFFMAHGDSLNIDDKKHIVTRVFFTNKLLQKLFASLHPGVGMKIAHAWSQSSRKQMKTVLPFKGVDEALYRFAKDKTETEHYDCFVFGHLHTPVKTNVGNDSEFVILPEWLSGGGYAVFAGDNLELKLI